MIFHPLTHLAAGLVLMALITVAIIDARNDEFAGQDHSDDDALRMIEGLFVLFTLFTIIGLIRSAIWAAAWALANV